MGSMVRERSAGDEVKAAVTVKEGSCPLAACVVLTPTSNVHVMIVAFAATSTGETGPAKATVLFAPSLQATLVAVTSEDTVNAVNWVVLVKVFRPLTMSTV